MFDGLGSWTFGNNFVMNVISFVVDNSFSSHAENCKNNILVLDEEGSFGVNRSFGAPEKKFSLNAKNA